MIKPVPVFLLAFLALGGTGAALADTDATPHQIYEAAQAGHIAEAQQMINQVLHDHPQNAKAHFIAAELDARIGDLPAARQQLATARQLDPTEGFTSAPALSALQRQLTGMRVAPAAGPQSFAVPAQHAAVPWVWIFVLGLAAFVLWSIFRNRAQRQVAAGYGSGVLPPGNPGMQPGYGAGYPPYPPQGGGPGLMGKLASGLAIGAGVAAGEELVHHVLDGREGEHLAPAADLRDPPQSQDLGGNDFGSQDGGSWGNDSGGDSGGGWGGDSGGDWT